MNRIQARNLIAMYDSNGNGKVAYSGKEGAEMSKSRAHLFHLADRAGNNDGSTGVRELRHLADAN